MSEDANPTGAMPLLRRLAGLLAIVALVAALLFLLSERNARTFAVEQRGDKLLVMRGRMFPWGLEPFAPQDKVLVQAYAPISLEGDSPGEVLLERYDDRDQLDRALFRMLRQWVEGRLDSDDPARLAQAMRFLGRAALLNGADEEERRQLRELQGRIAFFEGRARMEESLSALREALAKLKLASEGNGRYSRYAGELYEALSPLSEQLGRATRRSSSAPAPELDKAAAPPPAQQTGVESSAAPLPAK